MHTPTRTPREFRLFLQQELARRCKKNPYFSLRAFARTLNVEVSSLSKILNGKRSLTKKMLHKICSQLGLGPDRVTYFEKRLRPHHRTVAKETVVSKKTECAQLTLDTFAIISEWYYYAILELATVKDFNPNPSWIAKVLGITVSEVNFAIERLQRVGVLSLTKDRWEQKAGHLTTIGSNFTAVALRRLQQQILDQARKSLVLVPMEKRDQSAMTVAIDSCKLKEAKQRIKKFRRELCEFMQDGNEQDEVYQLSISLFPVSKVDK